jgi:hypothetical protein
MLCERAKRFGFHRRGAATRRDARLRGVRAREITTFTDDIRASGMCFSDEPMIAIPGEFGIRLEDCLHMTEQGPVFFSAQSTAIDKPFA